MQALLAAIAIMVVHGHCVHCTLAYKLDQLQFVSRTEGWAAAFVIESNGHVSQNSALVHTTDGGKHWRQLPDVETYGVEVEPAFWFLDAKNGWVTWPVASTAEDHLIRTHDGGRSWRNGRAHGYLPHIRFFTDRVGVAVESTGDKPLFLSTTNGGADWHRQPLEL